MHYLQSLDETYERMLRDRQPNFLRLYLNPYVAQACFCLDRYVRTTWREHLATTRRPNAWSADCQSFLANGFEEAVSGAIKLARYTRQGTVPRSNGLALDPADRLWGYASVDLAGGGIVRFLPGLRVLGKNQLVREPGTLVLEDAAESGQTGSRATGLNPLVLVAGAAQLLDRYAETIRLLVRRYEPLVITCVDRESLATLRGGSGSILHELVPDVVVFDESFTDHAVPFGAFTARRSLFDCWNRPGTATFHSTTFQPNTISTLHFMRCLARDDPEFLGQYSEVLQGILADPCRRGAWFRRTYSPSLYRLIRATGFDTTNVRATGSFIILNDRSVFDAVSGVACSMRGHNPSTYAVEMKAIGSVPPPEGRGEAVPADPDLSHEGELRRRLEDLTGLEFFLPAVSGATAVENALKLALVAQFPRRHIMALEAGFGGKTLLALTGTANPSYKKHIDPLYPDVHYVDPFAPDALAQIDALLERHEFAVIQVELIQAVGGVRLVPEHVLRHLDLGRKRWGYLLLVDEVQTGMYRTGPFIRSQALDLKPDLLLLGKGTSDMMFPFALTLYSAKVQTMLGCHGAGLTNAVKERYGYEQGYKTVVNVLRRSEELILSRQVADAGSLFAELLKGGLGASKIVRDVRVFGLLIGIELNARRWPHRWLGKRLSSLYLMSMLRHGRFPVLASFCQCEPNVLKITPALTVSRDEIQNACTTIVDVLGWPLPRVLATSLGGLIKSSSIWSKKP
jgi:acetylornithine/succinyldiaminopimelate/putrescine aminotransferase